MSRGFAHPLLIALFLLLLGIPTYKLLSSWSFSQKDVKGSSTYSNADVLNVSVSSKGTWSLSLYLCDSRDACTKSVTSGDREFIVNGSATDSKSVQIKIDPLWDKDSYIKIIAQNTGEGNTFKLTNYAYANHSFGSGDGFVIKLGETLKLSDPISFSDR